MIKKVLSAIVLLLMISVAIVHAMDNKKEEAASAPGLETGNKAPGFKLTTIDGKSVKLSDYRGKKIMLNFWATWCPPCKKEIPEMEEYSKQMGKDQIILAVNMDPQADVKGFAAKMGMTFPILLDTDNEVNTTYKIISIPTTYFIDSKGIISSKILGAMTKKDMADNMNKMK
ncbi:redoxin domain-containing protein [Peribacillus deserti]|uniref:Alkyl hydroperoxide reductase n=1 Tax=Peribacillus deserti TaxID=673318 RepID=A0A2N5M4Q4_9BACI|nr:redoxin domain-containing protein [Peribacillus deserti]PLT29339.1 alkyl hydroperoxide reductase [Peribacillus deserti]